MPEDQLWQTIPQGVRSQIVAIRYEKYLGKNVVLDTTSATYRSNANLESAAANAIHQQSSVSGVSEFQHKCRDTAVRGGRAKICNVFFKERGRILMLKALFVIGHVDPRTLYGLTGYYTQHHDESVLDRIFESVVLEK